MAMKAESSLPAQMPASANQSFERLTEPFRQELKLHCYRMFGSLHEAEDAVQETYLRAWRSFASFDNRAGSGSIRAWLYRIATNACLNVLACRKSAQRLLPDQIGDPTEDLPGAPSNDIAWLEPFPDGEMEWVADNAPSPEARYSSREGVQLAFVAAIQLLPPRQRAAIILCGVIGWSAGEAASLLGGSTGSINSALQRARETLGKHFPDGRPPVTTRPNSAQQQLLGRYLRAWEGHDLDAFVALVKENATLIMPPCIEWYAGRDAIRSFSEVVWKQYGGLRLIPTAANGQPAFAVYKPTGIDAQRSAHSIHVLALEHGFISTLTVFKELGEPSLFQAFGLPLVLREAPSIEAANG